MNTNDKREKETLRINEQFMPGWNESQSDIVTNAMRQARRDEVLLTNPTQDANSMTDEDFENMVCSPVMDKYQRVIGYKSVIRKKKR